MTNTIDNAVVFNMSSYLRVYPGFRLETGDLVSKTVSSINKVYGEKTLRLHSTVIAKIKEEVLAEMHQKLGTEALVYLLGIHQRDASRITKDLEAGNYTSLASEVAFSKSLGKDVKFRKDASSATILKKVQSAIEKIEEERVAYDYDLGKRLLESLSQQFDNVERDYRDGMIDIIDRNADHFDEMTNGKASDLEIKIAGLEAQLAEAKKQLQSVRNEAVVKFAESDGKINENTIVEPVREAIKEKAEKKGFFNKRSIFG